ncbi:MAG: hypothetical protein ACE5DX_04795 [Candidatus Dojkabacteria bacterium]
MIEVFKHYIINFWVWWYLVRGRHVLERIVGIWNFTLGYFNVVPMLRNLFVPLYQDYSNIGIVISIPIRLVWVIVGSAMQLLITAPLLIAYMIFLMLPLLPVYGLLNFAINLL